MKSDIAVTRTRRLSKRVAVEVTMSANGVVCEWDPRQPDDERPAPRAGRKVDRQDEPRIEGRRS